MNDNKIHWNNILQYSSKFMRRPSQQNLHTSWGDAIERLNSDVS